MMFPLPSSLLMIARKGKKEKEIVHRLYLAIMIYRPKGILFETKEKVLPFFPGKMLVGILQELKQRHSYI